ncbi:Farnesyl-diphosphate farnesyltransferase [Boothiomyces sp. JEL0838]|nr:Farnesyl-diphosphate farnesyltransferase [Boothiomyces sp. JEL0838]
MSAIYQSILHPSEIYSLVKYKLLDEKPEKTRLNHLLNITSRSFARVIQSLDPEIRQAVCIFYLVLRGLDTIEDDMTIPKEEKIPLLRIFHEKIYEEGYCYYGNGPNEKDAVLLHSFDHVIEEFLKLKPKYQKVIADITKRMGNGMADFITKKVETMQDYNLYTHYVAGLVGIGLTELFKESNLEKELDLDQANEMGLFLQKTNILKDFVTDLEEGRDPKEFVLPENREKALSCLNDLVADALELVPSCLSYMSKLENKSVFHFCAIPQVMAIATLVLFLNNYSVFEKSVKIRRGLAVKLITDITDFEKMKQLYYDYALEINEKARNVDGEYNIGRVTEACANIVRWIRADDQRKQVTRKTTGYVYYILLFMVLAVVFISQ